MVTVTDAWGCTGQAGVNLVSPPEMNVQVVSTEPKCYNTTDGSILASAFGGMAPYSYLWNNSSSENELTGIGMGTYSLTISDATGCSAVRTWLKLLLIATQKRNHRIFLFGRRKTFQLNSGKSLHYQKCGGLTLVMNAN